MKQDVVCRLQKWGWSPEPWFREGLEGWAWLNAKVRLSVGLWGWKEKQALLLKWICHIEYAAAVLHYQCMSSPTVDSLVGYA